MRSARVLLDAELAAGLADDAAVAALAASAPLRGGRVPPLPLRVWQLIERRRGRLDHLGAVAAPYADARRAALGERAPAAPPRFLVRVDEFPHYKAWDESKRFGSDVFRTFDAIMAEAGVPYLLAATPRVSRSPLDPTERRWRALDEGETELLRSLAGPRVTFALHGRDHRTRHALPRLHSELTGLAPAATGALLDSALADLERAGVARPEIFVPPYNRFDAGQYAALAERFAIVCAGPETIATMGFQPTPRWRAGALYLPSYAPLYARARDVLPAVRELVAQGAGGWAPITLHWGWEADAGWSELEELARELSGLAVSWEELLAPVRRERGAAATTV